MNTTHISWKHCYIYCFTSCFFREDNISDLITLIIHNIVEISLWLKACIRCNLAEGTEGMGSF